MHFVIIIITNLSLINNANAIEWHRMASNSKHSANRKYREHRKHKE